ncbi:BCCT family transporter [Arthrobacter sp. AQ5-05]|uniref:BCCT family transporter n=1 Tax=Arthrobacter sp. AQ5-05 TaxID=2184581 RepID=UPI002570A693|nr:BCCT family transporter [Arthrobacter sp. AQ5-05]
MRFITPLAADPESAAAAQDAVVGAMFHYGSAGRSMYALLGPAMGCFAYRWGMVPQVRKEPDEEEKTTSGAASPRGPVFRPVWRRPGPHLPGRGACVPPPGWHSAPSNNSGGHCG